MYNPLTHKKPYGATVINKSTEITFPLPCSMGVKRVFIVLRKIFGQGHEKTLRYELPYQRSDNGEDVFVGAFSLSEWGIWNYRFEGELQDGSLAFFGRGCNGDAIRGDWLPEWQLTVSKCELKVPDWANKGVIYHIFADRFCKGEKREFCKAGRLHNDWNERPDVQEEGADYKADDFFGGNIAGILSKLDYIKSLGASCIYLSPIFKSSSNHRYDTGDYLQIDELFGDEEQFALLVKECEKLGIKIMLDGVFNHTGADSLYFNKFGNYSTVGAYQSENSPYYDWFYFDDYPSKYHCWWGSTVVPTVNKSAKGFRDLILGKGGVIEKWSETGVKGWRLDVVDELPVEFTTELCKKIKQADNDCFIVGEVWEDASVKISYDIWRPYLMGEQLHSVMNYPFKDAILSFVLQGDKDGFVEKVSKILENYPKQTLNALMNLIDSHDTVRALTFLSGVQPPETKKEKAEYNLSKQDYERAKRRLMIASVLQYTLPGVPCLYYGDEAGVQGFEDPLNRATYPWGREDKELLDHYRKLGELRKKYADILLGEMRFDISGEDLAYERVSEYGTLRVEINSQNVRVCVNGKTVLQI